MLLLFTIETKTDAGMKKHVRAFVSVLEEYKGHRPCQASRFAHSAYSAYYTYTSYFTYSVYSAYSAYCDPIVYRMGGCLPVNHSLRAPCISSSLLCCSSVLHTGGLPLIPVGDTGTTPFEMRGESADFPGASCDSKTQSGRDGCWWCYVNSWALSWGTKQ